MSSLGMFSYFTYEKTIIYINLLICCWYVVIGIQEIIYVFVLRIYGYWITAFIMLFVLFIVIRNVNLVLYKFIIYILYGGYKLYNYSL